MQRFLVSILQYDIKSEPLNNFKTLEKMFAIAGGRKSKFVILPEMFACSFNYKHLETFSKHSIEILKYLQKTALQYQFYIVGGSLPVRNNLEHKYYNRCYLISPDGAVAGQYDKNHIFFSKREKEFFIPGKTTNKFSTMFAPIGIQICFDIRFPENIRELVKKGAFIIFVPAQFPDPRQEHWITLLKSRAIENQVYIVAANRIGDDGENSYFGNSVIIDPYGKILANGEEKESVISEYIDLDFLKAYRKNFPVLPWG